MGRNHSFLNRELWEAISASTQSSGIILPIAAVVKLIPDDWALALMASQSSRFRKL